MSENWASNADDQPEVESTGAVPDKAEVVYWEEEEIKQSEKVQIRLLINDQFDGKYLVENMETKEVFLIPAEGVQLSMKEQEIEKSALSAGVRPYNWDTEIDQILVTREKVRRALWVSGRVSKEDSPSPKSIRGILNTLISNGLLPVIEEQ